MSQNCKEEWLPAGSEDQTQRMRRTIIALQSRIYDLENQQRDVVSLRDRIAIAAMLPDCRRHVGSSWEVGGVIDSEGVRAHEMLLRYA